jgi:transposase
MPHISTEDRVRIITLYNENYSKKKISSIIGIARSTVTYIIKRYLETGSYEDRKKSGIPRKFSDRDRREIVRMIKTHQCDTATEVKNYWNRTKENTISLTEVRNILKAGGLQARVRIKKPLLTREVKAKRLEWAKRHESWTLQKWEKVLWSDETKFELYPTGYRRYVWLSRGDPLSIRVIKPTVYHKGGKIFVWGCISGKGIGYLTKINNGLDAELYEKILNDEMKLSVKWLFAEND